MISSNVLMPLYRTAPCLAAVPDGSPLYRPQFDPGSRQPSYSPLASGVQECAIS